MSDQDGWMAPGGGDGEGASGPRSLPLPPGPGPIAPVAPTPPGGRSPVRRTGLVVAGALAVLAAGLGAVAVATSGGDGDEGDDRRDRGAGSGRGAVAVPDLVPFTDPGGEVGISVPADWVAVSTRGDLSGAGAEAFPEDDDKAEALDEVLASLPRLVVLLAADPDTVGDRFMSNLNMARQPLVPATDELDEIEENARRQIEGSPVELLSTPRRLELPAGEALRMDYVNEAAGFEFVQYTVIAGDFGWTLTLNAADLDDYEGLDDAVAETFELTGAAGGT